MRIHSLYGLLVIFPLLLALLTGCGGTAPGSIGSGSGYGADAGPWPTAPNRNSGVNRPAADEPPKAPLLVFLRADAPANKELSLSVSKIELKYADQWVTVANDAEINKLHTLPLRVGDKGGVALLANTHIPRRNYTAIRLSLADKKTLFLEKSLSRPLTVETTTQLLGEWSMDAKLPNILTFVLNGGKLAVTEHGATLPAAAASISKGTATGSVTGIIKPLVANAKIEALWADTDIVLGEAFPRTPDGAFTLANLPPGSYKIRIQANGYKVLAPLTKPILVTDKASPLGTIQLAEEARH